MEGTKDESALLSSVAAAVFAEEVGRDRISAYNRNLRKQAETVLARAWGKEGDADCYLCPIEMRGYMVQVKTPLLDPLTDPKNTASASASTSSSSSSSTSASSTPASSAATPAMFSAEEKDGFKNEAIPGVGTIGQLATKPHAGSKRANDLFNQLLTEYKICSPVVRYVWHAISLLHSFCLLFCVRHVIVMYFNILFFMSLFFSLSYFCAAVSTATFIAAFPAKSSTESRTTTSFLWPSSRSPPGRHCPRRPLRHSRPPHRTTSDYVSCWDARRRIDIILMNVGIIVTIVTRYIFRQYCGILYIFRNRSLAVA